MSKFKERDCILLKDMLFEDFIKLHQLLENNGEPMYMNTEYRIWDGYIQGDYFKIVDGEWMFSGRGNNLIPLSDIYQIFGKTFEVQYEIY